MRWLFAIALLFCSPIWATVHYADSAGTQGTGDGSSAANAATLKQCMENDAVLAVALAAGDTIYCKNGTTITYNGSAGVFATVAVAGTAATPIQVISYASTVTDGGVTTINDSDAGATNNCINVTVSFWEFYNFKITNARDAWNLAANGGMFFYNCSAVGPNTGTGDGWDRSGSGVACIWVNCYVEKHAMGFSDVGRAAAFINCVSVDNVTHGFEAGSTYGSFFANCFSHANGSDGFDVSNTVRLINCVSNRNGSDGFYFATATRSVLVNSGATSNGAYGVQGVSGADILAVNSGLHPTNETNTSGKSATVTLTEIGEVTGDPDFTDSNPATPADVDLSLSATSAWKAAGIGIGTDAWTSTATYFDLGPAQRQESGGGSVVIIIED